MDFIQVVSDYISDNNDNYGLWVNICMIRCNFARFQLEDL